MPSATLNNSDPGSAIGQAGKSHSPASFKIKGQGGIKEKDNTSLKQRLHSAVPISQVPTTFCCRESAGARVLRWCQGTAPRCTSQCTLHTSLHTSLHTLAPGKLTHLPWWHHSSSPAARECQLCSRHWPTLTSQALLQSLEGKIPSGLSHGSRSPLNSSRFSALPAPFPNYSHTSPVPADRAGHTEFQARLQDTVRRHQSIRVSPYLGPAEPGAGGYQVTSTTFRALSWVCLVERSYILWGLKDTVLLKSH